MIHSVVSCAGYTWCDHLYRSKSRHLWHSWHLCWSRKLGLIRNTSFQTVSVAGICCSQSNQVCSFYLKAESSPTWHDGVSLMARKKKENPDHLVPCGNWCCVGEMHTQRTNIWHLKIEHMAIQASHGAQMVPLKHNVQVWMWTRILCCSEKRI